MGSSEKTILPTAEVTPSPPVLRKCIWCKPLAGALLTILLAIPYIFPSLSLFSLNSAPSASSSLCSQADLLIPKSFNVSSIVKNQKLRIIQWLSDAVKIPTEGFDDMGIIGEDPRWDIFYKFADYLETAFPLVHENLSRTRVMTHALVYEWKGSDPSLKPLLITGHQDVVPVLPATRGMWSHDPYGGEYDGTLIWGRGSSDDKSGTIGALSAIELLIESGKFQPTRTVILALGMDEETGGKVGAYHLGQWIEAKYGKDSIGMLVDEGNGLNELWGQLYASPAVGEKGYLDVEIKVETLGGHSSVPPSHTGIGLISLLIAELEKNPHAPYLNPESPLVAYLSCAADYSPGIPKDLQKAVRKVTDSLSAKSGKVNKKALKVVEDWLVEGSYKDGTLMRGLGKAMVSTTQAVDIINGGVKVNALPEVVTAVVNHRISIASSVEELQKHMTDTLSPVAEKYNLALEAFGEDVKVKQCPMHTTADKSGKIILSEAWHSHLNPAPVSPYTVDSAAWRLLSGTVKGVYATRPEALSSQEEAKKVVHMAPSISTGNTDTKRYWNLTRNIYRFAYQYSAKNSGGFNNVHTVDEFMPADSFVEQVRWFANFIVNVDESREI